MIDKIKVKEYKWREAELRKDIYGDYILIATLYMREYSIYAVLGSFDNREDGYITAEYLNSDFVRPIHLKNYLGNLKFHEILLRDNVDYMKIELWGKDKIKYLDLGSTRISDDELEDYFRNTIVTSFLCRGLWPLFC